MGLYDGGVEMWPGLATRGSNDEVTTEHSPPRATSVSADMRPRAIPNLAAALAPPVTARVGILGGCRNRRRVTLRTRNGNIVGIRGV
jgi:hypothetical protein